MYEKNGMSCLADAPANLVDPSVITKSIPAALSIIDRNLRIVWMNTVQEGWFGPLGLLKGRHCYEVYERRKGVCPGCPSIKVFKYGLPECASIRRNIIVNVNGKEKKGDFKLTATPIKNEKGEVTQVLELVEDVTEEVRVEKTVKKKLSKVTKQLDFISELDKKFAYSHDNSLEEILKEAIELTPILFGSRICNLRLLESSRSLLVTKASKGLSKDYLKNTIMKVGEGIAGRVASTKKPLIISDVLSSRESKFMECIKREGINSVICVPITLKNSVLGTLSIYDRKMGAFVEEDRSLLMNFANHLAILIDNVKTHRKIFISYINTIKSLVSAVEARDLYTRGHSEKVTWFALAIASAMNLPKNDRVMLSYCGRLHDIGKIAISDLILNKRGPLTTAEKAEIQLHPLKGVEILSNLKFIEKGLPAIRHHHERYDGTGYPDELKEKEIPLLARIIACADAFDAMISDRAYRPGMNTKEAITELRANRGKQFDPNILDVFIDLILKNNAQLTAAK